jgi:hypothetical protein
VLDWFCFVGVEGGQAGVVLGHVRQQKVHHAQHETSLIESSNDLALRGSEW